MPRRLILLLVPLLVVLAAGCGNRTFDTPKLEKSIKQAAQRDLHFPLKSVHCADGIRIRKGDVFYCQAVSRSGGKARVKVTQRDNHGNVLIVVPA